jgi:hypothetical protein
MCCILSNLKNSIAMVRYCPKNIDKEMHNKTRGKGVKKQCSKVTIRVF